jgi:F-type H+-transporting ATPase subunit b
MLFLADFSVIKPEPGLLFWMTLIFLLFWFIMSRVAFKPIAAALKKREGDIQEALDQAKMAREEMSNLTAQNEALLKEAREERAKILKEATETKDAIINEARSKAKEEANKVITNAKMEIDNQKNAAIAEVKSQAGLLAIQIAEKVLRKELSSNAEQVKYANDLVNEIKLN